MSAMLEGDIGLFIQADDTIDLVVEANDLKLDDGLQTAVIISLFTEARVSEEDKPEWAQNRGGWWGDLFAENPGDQIGSRLWLLAREKRTVETLNRAVEYAEEALQWMVDDGVADSIEATAEWDPNGAMALVVLIQQPGGEQERYRFKVKWATEGGRN